MNRLKIHQKEINRICERHHVEQLFAFGSVLTEAFNDESDIDLVVHFGKVELAEYFNNFMGFKEEMETLLGRNVDLIENKAVKNPIFRKILDRDMQNIYERAAA